MSKIIFAKDGKTALLTSEQLENLIQNGQKANEQDKENETQTITICKNCVFAEYEEIENVKVQNGCFLGRIEKFIDKHPDKVVGVKEVDIDKDTLEELDTSTQFAVINGRICTTLREEEWIQKQIEKHCGKDEGISIEELASVANREVDIQNNTTIIITIPENTNWDEMKSCVEHLNRFTKKIKHVIFMNMSKKLMPSVCLYNMNNEYPKLPFTWQVEFVLGGTHDHKVKDLLHQCVDIAVKKCKSVYYICSDVKEPVSEQYIDSINNAINKDLEQIIVVHKDREINGLFSQVRLHKLVGGFNKNNYIDKIEKITKDQECQNMIRTYQSLQ